MKHRKEAEKMGHLAAIASRKFSAMKNAENIYNLYKTILED